MLYFLRLGTFGFGGPIALVGYMQRDLVERRALDLEAGLHARGSRSRSSRPARSPRSSRSTSAGCAAGSLGATLVAIAFVLPSFVMVLVAVRALPRATAGLTWMQGAFYGIGAAVIAIIARSAYKLMR